ncbi:hypothetical protein EVAR_63887_1 [Eumeta japonica]|uniref:Uncharacterized protein n=1 Tax=Eumeta variegata TaxID=151549 RepID=A0A4C1ZGN2_EUMVA|nr:hypothetical protein EVAR_63887_1 [Eumeta japonica]
MYARCPNTAKAMSSIPLADNGPCGFALAGRAAGRGALMLDGEWRRAASVVVTSREMKLNCGAGGGAAGKRNSMEQNYR